MNSKLSQRELEICQRLKAFRLGKLISRSAFAVAIGIGSERLASYESGRAPLPFKIFRAIQREFHLNPNWLATGGDYLPDGGPAKMSELPEHVPERALFSEVFDRHLKPLSKKGSRTADVALNKVLEETESFMALIRAGKVPPRWVRHFRTTIETMVEDMLKTQGLSRRVDAALATVRKEGAAAEKKKR